MTREIVLGVLSMILWSLIVVVTLKYVVLLLRCRQQRRGRHAVADGARVPRARPAHAVVFLLGMIGAAMFYGDRR